MRRSFLPAADLGNTRMAKPVVVEAGGYVIYPLTVTNRGPVAATNVDVRDSPFGVAADQDWGNNLYLMPGITVAGAPETQRSSSAWSARSRRCHRVKKLYKTEPPD